MTTRFARADNGKFVQLPHSLLNTYWIENLSRSKVLKEYFTIAVNPDTSFKTIEDIEKDLVRFVERNKRDFKKDTVHISLSSINDLTQLKLDVEVEHKVRELFLAARQQMKPPMRKRSLNALSHLLVDANMSANSSNTSTMMSTVTAKSASSKP